MAKENLIAPRAATAQPDPNSTRVQQKGYQLDEDFNALQVNQEFDRVYEALNKITAGATNLPDLSLIAAGATLVEVVTALQDAQTKINAFGAILRQSGLMK